MAISFYPNLLWFNKEKNVVKEVFIFPLPLLFFFSPSCSGGLWAVQLTLCVGVVRRLSGHVQYTWVTKGLVNPRSTIEEQSAKRCTIWMVEEEWKVVWRPQLYHIPLDSIHQSLSPRERPSLSQVVCVFHVYEAEMRRQFCIK